MFGRARCQGTGNWPGTISGQTLLSDSANVGDTVVTVNEPSIFQVGTYAIFGNPGNQPIETKYINEINGDQLTLRNDIMAAPGLANSYPAATSIHSGNTDNDYRISFGGSSHACPTVAGAAALLLSVKPDLTWIEVRSLLRDHTEQIDFMQTNDPGLWEDLDGDGVKEFSLWYGYGRLDVSASLNAAIALDQRTDVVIRDNLNDIGEVPSPGWHANSPDIWIRQNDEPVTELDYNSPPQHQNPRYGQDNYVFLRVRNFGDATAPVVYVRALLTHFPGIEFQYPEDWQPTPGFGEEVEPPLVPGTYLIGEIQIADLDPGESVIVKMTWDSSLVPPHEVEIEGNTVRCRLRNKAKSRHKEQLVSNT